MGPVIDDVVLPFNLNAVMVERIETEGLASVLEQYGVNVDTLYARQALDQQRVPVTPIASPNGNLIGFLRGAMSPSRDDPRRSSHYLEHLATDRD